MSYNYRTCHNARWVAAFLSVGDETVASAGRMDSQLRDPLMENPGEYPSAEGDLRSSQARAENVDCG